MQADPVIGDMVVGGSKVMTIADKNALIARVGTVHGCQTVKATSYFEKGYPRREIVYCQAHCGGKIEISYAEKLALECTVTIKVGHAADCSTPKPPRIYGKCVDDVLRRGMQSGASYAQIAAELATISGRPVNPDSLIARRARQAERALEERKRGGLES
jgi:hypothetical protein